MFVNNCLIFIFDLVWKIMQNNIYVILSYVVCILIGFIAFWTLELSYLCTNIYMSLSALKIHQAELTQAELTQGWVDSGADLTSGRVDPLPVALASLGNTFYPQYWFNPGRPILAWLKKMLTGT